MSRYIRALAGEDNDVVVMLSDSTDAVKKAQAIHKTSPVATAALGRVLTAVQLMGCALKGDRESVSLMIQGSAAIKKIYAYQDSQGHLKGYITDPVVPTVLKANGKLDVSGAVGVHGNLIVNRDNGYGNPFLGQSNLVSGEIAEDLAHYYAASEQQPSVISLGVLVGKDNLPQASGGLMIQLLPGCSEQSIEKLEQLVPAFRPMSEMVASGMTLEEILSDFLKDMPYHILSEGTFDYTCDCSWDRIESAVITLGVSELQKILKEDGHIELNCHFCSKKYHYDSKAMQQLIGRLKLSQEVN